MRALASIASELICIVRPVYPFGRHKGKLMKQNKSANACPFCGFLSTQVLGSTTKPNTSTHAKGYQVECVNCGARGPCGMSTPKDAVAVWDNGDLDYDRPLIQRR
jgi:transcription elongation factor Elf1